MSEYYSLNRRPSELILDEDTEVFHSERTDFNPAGYKRLEEMTDEQRQRVYYGYISSIKGILDRFDIELNTLRVRRETVENERKNLERNLRANRLLLIITGAIVAVIAIAMISVYTFTDKTRGVSAFSGGGIGGDMNTKGFVMVEMGGGMVVFVLVCLALYFLVGYLTAHAQYQYFMEAMPYRKSIEKNDAATYFNQSDYYSGAIILLEKRRKKYDKLLKRIERGEEVTEEEVQIVDQFDKNEYKYDTNKKIDYRVTLRDVPAIIFHRDNWGPSTVRDKNDKVYKKR